MNLIKSPFARSIGGRTFAILMLLPLFHIVIAIAMTLQNIDPGPTAWMVAAEILLMYGVSLFLYRAEVAAATNV